MPALRLTPAPAAVAAALLLAGCGNPGGDLIAIEERAPGGATTRLVVTDDGRGRCNGGELKRLESARLIEAREVARELEELPGERSDFGRLENRSNYRAIMREKQVTWAEGARQPPVLGKATLLALKVRRETCGGAPGGGATAPGPGPGDAAP